MARRHQPADPAIIVAAAAATALAFFAGAVLSWILPKGTLGSGSVLTVVPPASVVATAPGSTSDAATSSPSSGPSSSPGPDSGSGQVEVMRLDWSPDSHSLMVIARVVPAPSDAAICEAIVTSSSDEIVAAGTWREAVDGGRECSASIEDARLDSEAGEVRVRVTDGAGIRESRPLPLG